MTRQPASTRPDTTAKTMAKAFARFFARPGRRNGDAAAETPDANRLLRVPAMDARFRRICAVFAGGRCLIARGYEADARLRSALLALRQSGAIPAAVAEETATLEEIAECWRAAGAASSPAAGEAAARRVKRLFEDAAAARASDVVFETGGGACHVFAIVNDRKLQLAEPMTAEEGREAAGFLFHCKDEGSSQTSYRRGSFQGFSIRAGGQVPLPAGVSALRCQRGPHEPDGDHLFARMFYSDRLDAGMTLERLGFSATEAALFAGIRMAPHGGVFIGGTAGDGKSTTLAVNLALQMAEFDGQLNLVTIEDPVEYRIPGAVQIAVPTSGLGDERAGHFKEALMHFCRIHPASGMVSEIRDADAARQVMQFIDTGHQVWTTIHVHSANAILFRLIDMGVGVAEVTKPGNVALLMKQTLLPLLCRIAPSSGTPRDALHRKIWPLACAATARCATATRRAVPGAGARTAARSRRGPGTATSNRRRSPRPSGPMPVISPSCATAIPWAPGPTGARRWTARRSAARSGSWWPREPSIRSTPCSRAPAPSTRRRRASPWSRRRSDDGAVPHGRLLEAGIRRVGARAQGAGGLLPHRRRPAGIGLRARTRARRHGAGATRPGSVLSRPLAGRLAPGADREPVSPRRWRPPRRQPRR